jgi:hypothetical protein
MRNKLASIARQCANRIIQLQILTMGHANSAGNSSHALTDIRAPHQVQKLDSV